MQLNMLDARLKNEDNFNIYGDNGKVYHGANQLWFEEIWQRRAGCGPCTAASILKYISSPSKPLYPYKDSSKVNFIKFMHEIWHYVTPTNRGVNTTEIFYGGVLCFAENNGVSFSSFHMNIHPWPAKRPGICELADFIERGLSLDCPVAFLNLSNGSLKNLDGWHWVTVLSLRRDEGGCGLTATIADAGNKFDIDLALWHKSSKLGGGFVYFE